MIATYQFTESKTVAALIDGIPETYEFHAGQTVRGTLVKTCQITRVYVVQRTGGALFSLPIDSVSDKGNQ
jgi:hypothetical protein